MRTTLTIDDDVAKELKAETRRSGQTFKDVVNLVLRRGLRSGQKPEPRLPRFKVQPFSSPFQPGVDPGRLNQLLDDMETEEFLSKRKRDDSPP